VRYHFVEVMIFSRRAEANIMFLIAFFDEKEKNS